MSVTQHFDETAQYDRDERTDETADTTTLTVGETTLAAFDHDGARYCVDCAVDHDKIDREQYHNNPWDVPAGGSVPLRSMTGTDHTYHCDHCGAEIPEP